MPAFTNAAPAAPTGISLTGSTKQINVKWTACPDYDYQYTLVQYGTASGGPWTTAGQTNGTSFEITGLSNATTYWARLAHVDSFGPTTLNYSTPVSATTDNFEGAVDARIASASINGARLVGQSVPSAALSSEALYAPLAVIGDVRNICRNPLGDRGTSGWEGSFLTATETGFNWATFSANAYKGQSCFNFDNRNAYYGEFVPVEFGDQFWASVMTIPRGGSTANFPFVIGITIYNKDKNIMKQNVAATRTAATSGFLEIAGACVVDHVDAVYIKPWILIDKPHNTATSGTFGDGYHFTNATWTRKNRGELIVDGTITGNHVAANTITGNHVAANTITADKIDTRNLTIKDAAGNTILGAGVPLNQNLINLGFSANMLKNTDNASNENFIGRGWSIGGYTSVAGANSSNFNYWTEQQRDGQNWNWQPIHANASVIFYDGVGKASSSNAEFVDIVSDFTPVLPSQRYELSARLANNRCQAELYALHFDRNGNFITANYLGSCNQPAGDARNINTWPKVGGFFTTHSSATSVRFLWRRWLTWDGEPNSFAWMLHPYFGRATDGQTTLSDYSPGGDWIPSNTVRPDNPITSGNIGTYMSTAAIGTAYIQDAAIGSAKIANAAVDTLRIAGESATVVRTFTNNTNYTGADGQQITVMDVNFTVPYDSKVLVCWSAKQSFVAGEKLYSFIIQLDGVNMYDTGQISFGQDLVQMLKATAVGPGTHNIKIFWGSSTTLYLGAQTLALWCSMR